MNKKLSILARLAALVALVGAGTSLAEQIVAPMPEAPVVPSAIAPYTTQPTDVEAKALGIYELGAPIQWGPVSLRPRAEYDFIYATGIQSSPSNHVKTLIQRISPGMLMQIGEHWSIDYSPLWTYYSDRNLRDTLDHSATVAWGTAYEDWILSLSQSYASSSDPIVETGTQTKQKLFLTSAEAARQITESLQLDLTAKQDLRYADRFSDSKEWSTTDFLNYQFGRQFTAGIGGGAGYVQLSGPDQTYEDALANATYKITERLSFLAHGGLEFRQTPHNVINPIFGGSLQYSPFKATTISLSGERTVTTSYFAGQITETTDFGASISQRFLTHYYLTVGGTYNDVRFINNTTGVLAGRKDHYFALNGRLSTSFLKDRATIAATYLYSDNTSNQAGFSYRSQQFGCELSYRY